MLYCGRDKWNGALVGRVEGQRGFKWSKETGKPQESKKSMDAHIHFGRTVQNLTKTKITSWINYIQSQEPSLSGTCAEGLQAKVKTPTKEIAPCVWFLESMAYPAEKRDGCLTAYSQLVKSCDTHVLQTKGIHFMLSSRLGSHKGSIFAELEYLRTCAWHLPPYCVYVF